jgi:DNA polymerase-3 subunit beta
VGLKFKTSGKLLHDALLATQQIVKGASVVPTLQCVLLECAKEGLTVIATDLDSSVLLTVPAEILEQGDTLVPSKLLLEMTASLKGDVTLELKKNRVHLIFEGGEADLECMATTDYPLVPRGDGAAEGDSWTCIDLAELQGALKRALPFLLTKQTEQPLANLLIQIDGDTATIYASDEHSMYREEFFCDGPKGHRVVVPKEAAGVLIALSGDEVRLKRGDNGGHVFVVGESQQIVFREPEGQHPEFDAFVAREEGTSVDLIKGDLLAALKRASVISETALLTTVGATSLRVQGAGERGEVDGLLAAAVTGEEVSFRAGCKFLERCLVAAEGEQVRLTVRRGPNKHMQCHFTDPLLVDNGRFALAIERIK